MIFDFSKIKLTENNALIFTAYLPSMNQNLEKLWKPLSDQEKTQAEKFINKPLRDRYVMSHGLLRYLLSFYVGSKPHEIEYSVNQFGKPFLKEESYRVQFNMSHSKDYAAYIMVLDCQVGIDIEWKDKTINFEEISDLVLSPGEINSFHKLTPEGKFQTFYDIWTKKEAIVKAIGDGLSYPIKTIEIMNSTNNVKGCYTTADRNTFHWSALQNLDDYAGAVALEHKVDKLIQIDMTTHQIINH